MDQIIQITILQVALIVMVMAVMTAHKIVLQTLIQIQIMIQIMMVMIMITMEFVTQGIAMMIMMAH